MNALVEATRAALKDASVAGDAIRAIALDTTGSTVIPVDDRLEPLDDYYLWCDHRAKDEAEEITAAAHRSGPAGDRVVRRRLFVGMGLRQAAPLVAPQSRQARALRDGTRAL
jgi:sugar (pentulose or hexulose) kinase